MRRNALRLLTPYVAALFALPLLFAGIISSHAQDSSQRPAEPDLTDAHLDKRKFLLGISLLGQSVEKDIELLRKMTGHAFDPGKSKPHTLSSGYLRFSESAPLFKNGLLMMSGRFSSISGDAGVIHLNTNFVVNKKTTCLSKEDLESVLGPPTRIIDTEAARSMRYGRGSGPSDIYHYIYNFQFTAQVIFAFRYDLCVNDITQSAKPSMER